jgi:hypothetical protein
MPSTTVPIGTKRSADWENNYDEKRQIKRGRENAPQGPRSQILLEYCMFADTF